MNSSNNDFKSTINNCVNGYLKEIFEHDYKIEKNNSVNDFNKDDKFSKYKIKQKNKSNRTKIKRLNENIAKIKQNMRMLTNKLYTLELEIEICNININILKLETK